MAEYFWEQEWERNTTLDDTREETAATKADADIDEALKRADSIVACVPGSSTDGAADLKVEKTTEEVKQDKILQFAEHL